MDIVVPSPGESITEVTLGQWHRQDGDWVETDEILVDIESDKATLEVRAPAAGVLHVKAKAGAEQKVGAAIASIDTSPKTYSLARATNRLPGPTILSTRASPATP